MDKIFKISGIVPRVDLKVSKDGYEFDFNSNYWILNKDVKITFGNFFESIDDVTFDGFKKALARYAEELSPGYTHIMYSIFIRMMRDTNSARVEVSTILNWKSSLGKDKEWYLGSLKSFLINWHDYGYKGIGNDVVKLLDSFTLSANPNIGASVANRCPYSGAFTDNEVIAINSELIRLFRENLIDIRAFSYVSLVQATAMRPAQLRQIRLCDLIHDGSSFFINMPRAKQLGKRFRSEFKKTAITEDLYLLLMNLISHQIKEIEAVLNVKLSDEYRGYVPLFLDPKVKLDRELTIKLLSSDYLHAPAIFLSNQLLRSFSRKQRAISERTGDIIVLSSRRFRHTRGTNIGRRGYGVEVIAEALDHSDTQNVKVYTENTPDTVQYIDEVVGKQLAPLANAFMGRVIESLEQGERGADPTALIPNDSNEAVGACGTNDFCVNGYESCYVCHKFRPLIDAPHEAVLKSLYKQKEQRLKETGSVEYANVKDRLILAVEQVVQECKRIKSEKERANG